MGRRSLARRGRVDPLEEALVALDQAGGIDLEQGLEDDRVLPEALVPVAVLGEAGVALAEGFDGQLGEADPGGGELGSSANGELEPADGGGVGGGGDAEVDVERSSA